MVEVLNCGQVNGYAHGRMAMDMGSVPCPSCINGHARGYELPHEHRHR